MGTHLQTGTAADLLTFSTFHHGPANSDRLTRVATASEEWNVGQRNGVTYVIKFDKNFSKKHLFTFSKQTQEKTASKAREIAKHTGRLDPSHALSNWHDAEMALLKAKIDKVAGNRALVETCWCGHDPDAHKACTQVGCACIGYHTPLPPQQGCGVCTHGRARHRTSGGCAIAPCTCTGFQTSYELARAWVGKVTTNPLLGALATANTCLILNWVPANEFKSKMIDSILVQDPHGAVPSRPALNPTQADINSATKVLDLDFGAARQGAVVLRDNAGTFQGYPGCKVKAVKIHSADANTRRWEVFHMDGTIGVGGAWPA